MQYPKYGTLEYIRRAALLDYKKIKLKRELDARYSDMKAKLDSMTHAYNILQSIKHDRS